MNKMQYFEVTFEDKALGTETKFLIPRDEILEITLGNDKYVMLKGEESIYKVRFFLLQEP